MEDTLVAIKIPGWSASTKKQLRTTPKLYLFDNGVANARRGELSVPVRESTTRFGDLYEGMVVQEMIRANDYLNLDLKFSYWRTNNDMEVDIIVSRGAGQPLAAIEIRSSKTPERKEFHGLEAFKTDYPTVPQYCICRVDRAYTTDQGIEVKPHHELVDLLNEISN
ncbi:MAG: DUF4143 domain-containing protein [Proteobacteria bacterium]|nr:DUF4143 domain-containing protein [Pseudomonadota bacterium]